MKQTESLIVAAQNQNIRTNVFKAKIDKSQKDMLSKLCNKADESIDHVVRGCSKLAQKDYKRRHGNLGKAVHWKLARKCNFEAGISIFACFLILKRRHYSATFMVYNVIA